VPIIKKRRFKYSVDPIVTDSIQAVIFCDRVSLPLRRSQLYQKHLKLAIIMSERKKQALNITYQKYKYVLEKRPQAVC
jgi:hypothetical protein